MARRLRFSVRELLLLTTVAALTIALLRTEFVESEALYLHVFGSMVDSTHDSRTPLDAPMSFTRDGRPWIRIATVEIFDRRTFGFFTPNDRRPAIEIDGTLRQTWSGDYRGRLHFWLDDNNLTYDVDWDSELRLDTVYYIDEHYDCFVLSQDANPYEALKRSLQTADSLADAQPHSSGH